MLLFQSHSPSNVLQVGEKKFHVQKRKRAPFNVNVIENIGSEKRSNWEESFPFLFYKYSRKSPTGTAQIGASLKPQIISRRPLKFRKWRLFLQKLSTITFF